MNVCMLRSVVGLFIVVFSLVQCGSGDNRSLKALVQGNPEGALFAEIQAQGITTEVYTENQDPTEYDLLIVEGSLHSAATLASHELLIDEALATGVPVLVLQAKEAQVLGGLSQHVRSASMDGDYLGYLIHRDGGGSDFTKAVSIGFPVPQSYEGGELRLNDDESSIIFSAPTKVPSKGVIDGAVLKNYVVLLKRFLKERSLHQEIAPYTNLVGDNRSIAFTDGDISLGFDVDSPPNYARYLHTQFHNFWNASVPVAGGKTAEEQTSITIDAYAFYDEVSQQYLVFLSQNGTAYIDATNNNAGRKSRIFGDGYYFQQAFLSEVSCSTQGAYIVDFSPKNVNNVSTYTDSTSATIGVNVSEHPSAGASYTVSHSVTRQIADWSIDNTSDNAFATKWNYHRTETRQIDYNKLPALSRNNMSFSNTVLWAVPRNVSGTVTFKVNASRTIDYTFKVSGISGSNLSNDPNYVGTPFSINVPLPQR